jgi:Legionella pneumophila major outer membrane protein precursor
MKTDFLRTLAGAVLALATLTGSAMAQDIQLASTTDINNISARLAELESRVAAGNIGSAGGDCGAVDTGCCDDCCKAGFIAGAEVLWLKAFEGDGNFGDFNYDEGYRFWIGYQRADGLGIRFRYFSFDQEADNGDLFDVTHTDLEIYDMVQIGCNWDLLVGAGVRYLDINFATEEIQTVPAIAQLPRLQSFTGPGPVVTAELYRHISDRAALYVIGRESILVGNFRDDGNLQEDSTLMVSELQLGGQLHRELASGALLFGRAGWEAQYYHDLSDDNETPISLIGVGFSAGIMR